MSQATLLKHHVPNSIITKIKDNALTFEQLQSLVGPNQARNCRWILYDDLQKFNSLDELMSLGAVCVLLQIETPNKPKVGHFILLLDHGNHLEHFDSYGLTMDQELAITHEQHLTRLFSKYRKPIHDNTVKLQSLREDVNTCGRWVVARLLLRHLTLDEFTKLIKHFHVLYDDLVAIMTMLLQFKN